MAWAWLGVAASNGSSLASAGTEARLKPMDLYLAKPTLCTQHANTWAFALLLSSILELLNLIFCTGPMIFFLPFFSPSHSHPTSFVYFPLEANMCSSTVASVWNMFFFLIMNCLFRFFYLLCFPHVLCNVVVEDYLFFQLELPPPHASGNMSSDPNISVLNSFQHPQALPDTVL